MMQVTCLGGARTVTGSAFLVENGHKTCFLVDCGMYQGGRMLENRNYGTENYRIQDLEAILITHAHIDHSGLTPRLVKMGYNRPIYASDATCDLLSILWMDAAHIQEMEAEWQSRKNRRRGGGSIEPLYVTADAEAAISLLRPLELNRDYDDLLTDASVRYISAGHILGAASLHLTVRGAQGSHRIGFSGDLGRQGQLIVPDPELLPPIDTVFMETTYGNRRHKSLEESKAELIHVIQEAYRNGGKVVIPAFAVERTQDLIYTMAEAYRDGRMPHDMPVFLDSPLAIKSTIIFRENPEFFDKETQAIIAAGNTPIQFPTLKFTPTTEESQQINNFAGPAVIIAGNGMATAGRIKHHLKHNLWRPNCHIVIVGFQAQGSMGRRLVEGVNRVKIFHEEVMVKAKVHTIGGFSGHADQAELLSWLERLMHPGLRVCLIHGEESSSRDFKAVAEARFPEANYFIPKWKETLRLKPCKEMVQIRTPELEPDERLALMKSRLQMILKGVEDGQVQLDAPAIRSLEKALDAAVYEAC